MLSMKNKYIVRSRISKAKFREILKYFCIDIEATKIAKFTKISEVSLCKIFKQIRIGQRMRGLESNEHSEVKNI